MPTFEKMNPIVRALAIPAIASIALGGSAMVEGCGSARPSGPACTYDQSKQYSFFPSNVDAEKVASVLHTTTAQVENGLIIPANCDPGIPAKDFADGAVIQVSNIPGKLAVQPNCLPLFSDVLPTNGAVSHHPGLACPAPAS